MPRSSRRRRALIPHKDEYEGETSCITLHTDLDDRLALRCDTPWDLGSGKDQHEAAAMKKGERKDPTCARERLGPRLKEIRRWLGMTQEALADAAGGSQPDISKLERAITDLPREKRRRVIEAVVRVVRDVEGEGRADVTRRELFQLAGFILPFPDAPERESKPSSAQRGMRAAAKVDTGEAAGQLRAQEGAWHVAAYHFVMAANDAGHRGDWSRWAMLNSRAALMAMSGSRFDQAEQLAQDVRRQAAPLAIGRIPLAAACVSLGWTSFEQGRYAEAEPRLIDGRNLIRNAIASGLTGTEEMEAREVLERSLHLLGRNSIAWACQANQDEQRRMREGLNFLQEAYNLGKEADIASAMGFNALAQVPALARREETRSIAWQRLDESKEKLRGHGTEVGHIHLQRGILRSQEGKLGLARHELETAREGFHQPVYYAVGLSRVLRESALLWLYEAEAEAARTAVASALAALALHPYEPNLDALRQAGAIAYDALGAKGFWRYWHGLLEEQLWQQDTGPFVDLRNLSLIFPATEAVPYLEEIAKRAENEVRQELARAGL